MKKSKFYNSVSTKIANNKNFNINNKFIEIILA